MKILKKIKSASRVVLNVQEEFEDTKGVIRIRIIEEQTTQWPREKVQKYK